MVEAVGGGLLRNRCKSLGNGEIQSVERAGFEGSQGLFDDRPASLNRVEVWGVGWKVEKFRSGCGDGLCNALYFVRRKVVHRHNLIWPQSRAQDFAEKSQKHFTVRGGGDGHRGLPVLAAGGTQHCYRSPVSPRGQPP